MIVKKSKANGKLIAPPSKSMAHRYLICAALADGESVIHNIDLSEDIKATLGCIKQLGSSAEIDGDKIIVHGNSGNCGKQNLSGKHNGSGAGNELNAEKSVSCAENCSLSQENIERLFNCNESGSTLRFFIPISLLRPEKSRFIGSKVLMTRPLTVYEEICRNQRISFKAGENGIETEGVLHAGDFTVPGNISSQFITGLLFTLPLLDDDSRIILTNSVESKPYIDMTLQVQEIFGIKAHWENETTLFVPGNQKYIAKEAAVEGDYSNSAFFEAFNYLGGKVQIEGLNEKSLQGDKIYLEYFKKLSEGFCTLDISDCPDLGPILFTMAAALQGGEFTGTKRLQIKESDRGRVMCEELAKFGIKTLREENRIVIYEGKPVQPEETVDGHNDHRIVMSMVTLLTVTGGKINGVEAVRKSLPDYFKRIKKLGIEFTTENDEEELLK